MKLRIKCSGVVQEVPSGTSYDASMYEEVKETLVQKEKKSYNKKK